MRGLAVACLVLAMLLEGAPASADQAPGRVAREVHRRGRYPSDLSVLPPDETVVGEESVEGTSPTFEERLRARRPVQLYRSGGEDTAPAAPPSDMSIPSLGPLGTIFGWLLVVVCVCLVLAAFVYALMQLRFKRPPPEDARPPTKPADADALLDPLLVMPELSAEELARQGRYREAIHALLVSGLLSTGFRPEGRARGTTAREVVAALSDEDARRSPLDALLSTTELIWFGGRDATAETYARARMLHADVERGARR